MRRHMILAAAAACIALQSSVDHGPRRAELQALASLLPRHSHQPGRAKRGSFKQKRRVEIAATARRRNRRR